MALAGGAVTRGHIPAAMESGKKVKRKKKKGKG